MGPNDGDGEKKVLHGSLRIIMAKSKVEGIWYEGKLMKETVQFPVDVTLHNTVRR